MGLISQWNEWDPRDRTGMLLGLSGNLLTPNRGGLMGALGAAGLGLAQDLDYYRKRAEMRAEREKQQELLKEQIANAQADRAFQEQRRQAMAKEQASRESIAARIQGSGLGLPGGTRPGGVSPQTGVPRGAISDPEQIAQLYLQSGVPELQAQGAQMLAQSAAARGDQAFKRSLIERWKDSSVNIPGLGNIPTQVNQYGQRVYPPAGVVESSAMAGLAGDQTAPETTSALSKPDEKGFLGKYVDMQKDRDKKAIEAIKGYFGGESADEQKKLTSPAKGFWDDVTEKLGFGGPKYQPDKDVIKKASEFVNYGKNKPGELEMLTAMEFARKNNRTEELTRLQQYYAAIYGKK